MRKEQTPFSLSFRISKPGSQPLRRAFLIALAPCLIVVLAALTGWLRLPSFAGSSLKPATPVQAAEVLRPLQTASDTSLASDGAPKGLTHGDWNGIRQAYEQQRRAAFSVKGEQRARNQAQQWLSRFDGRGVSVEPDSADWRWGLELRSYGFPSQPQTIAGRAQVSAAAERVTYTWNQTVQEWFVNQPNGLEHGFTLRERPVGETNEQLELRLAVRGSLHPQAQTGGRGISFVNEQGCTVVNYAGLKVWDANGRELAARVEPEKDGVLLTLEERDAQYPLTIDPIAQQAYLKASNTGANDSFGRAVAMSGDTAVVGASAEDSSATGVNGDQTSNGASDAGAVYVFVRSGGVWSQEAYLKASNTQAFDNFGGAVAVAGDTIVVAAQGEDSAATGVNGNQADNSANFAGAAYVFTRSGTAWSQQAYLKASNTGANDRFGYSVAITGDTVVVGAKDEASSATGVNGNQSNNSASGAGAAYVFVRSGTTWTQQAYLKASNTGVSDSFGWSVAAAGDTVVVGATGEASAATGVNGNQSDNSAFAAGAAYVFVRSGTTWSQQAYLKASNTGASDSFGSLVAVSGDTAVVGAPMEDSAATGVDGDQNSNGATNAGAAYVFIRNGATWSQQAYLKASNTGADDSFGFAVAVAGDTVAIGAPGEDSSATGVNGSQNNNGVSDSGAAYVFTRSGATWSQQYYLKASNTGTVDSFGWSVATSGGTVVVGAPFESSAATGVNGDESNNSASGAGGAYVFTDLSSPALNVSKSNPAPALVPGQNSTYTITVTNNSAAAATTATVNELLPAGLDLISAAGTNWICTPTTGSGPVTVICTFSGGTIAANGGTSTISIGVIPTVVGTITNRISVDPTGGTNPPGPATCTALNTPNAGCGAPVTSTSSPGPYTVINTNDSGPGSLRQIISEAPSGTLISFAVTGTITLTSGQLTISQNLTIQGPGANVLTISGNNLVRVFQVNSGFTVGISGLTIANGNAAAGNGGGITNGNSTLTVTNCTLTGNSADLGGGIFNVAGTLTVTGSTLSGNSASYGGGTFSNAGTLIVTNSTLSGNSVTGNGGGLVSANNCAATMRNSTLTGNSAFSGGGASSSDGATPAGTLNVKSTIIAGNTATTGPDVSGTLTSQGFNLIGDNSGVTITPTLSTDQIGTSGSPINPLLGSLTNNGGPIQTHALLSGSPALDKGSNNPAALTNDQRGAGFARTVDMPVVPNATGGDGTDVGAFEYVPPPSADLTLVKSDGGASFTLDATGSYSILVSNAAGAVATTGAITVTDTLPGNLSLASFSGTGWSCTGTTSVSCTHAGPIAAAASLPVLTLTVNVGVATPTGVNSISNTATVTTPGENDPTNNSGSDTTTVVCPTQGMISPSLRPHPAAGGTDTVAVAVLGSCPWTAVSNAAWITVTSGASGNGNGTVGYSVAANTGLARSGTITIAGQTFTVNQADGCSFTINPTSVNVAAGGGPGSVTVTASNSACPRTAVSNAAWITVTSGASGTGNGTVGYSVAANLGAPRTGTITIGGQTFTVNQSGCAYTLTPTSQNFGAAGGSNSVAVTTSSICSWTAASNDVWITITGGESGTGNGTVFYDVALNNTLSPRTGTLTIGGQTFTVTQDAFPVFNGSTVNVGAGQAYTSLSNAGGLFEALNQSILTGHLTVNITSDLTSETGSVALNQIAETFSPSGYNVTVKPFGAARAISGSSNTALIKLYGTDRFTLDGSLNGGTDRSLTVTNTNTNAAPGPFAVIQLLSLGQNAGASNNTFKNLIISSQADQSASNARTVYGILCAGDITPPEADFLLFSGGFGNHQNTYANNQITKVSHGIVSYGSSSFGDSEWNQQTVIRDNLIGASAFGPDQVRLAGIWLAHDADGLITNNEVRFVGVWHTLNTPAGTTGVAGIVAADEAQLQPLNGAVRNLTLARNRVHDIAHLKGQTAAGIVVAAHGTGIQSNNKVVNNFVWNIQANGINTSGPGNLSAAGIQIGLSENDLVAFNSIRLTGDLDPAGAAQTARQASGIDVYSNGTGWVVKNNIARMDVTSFNTVYKHPAISLTGAVPADGMLDYNDWSTNASNAQSAVGTTNSSTYYASLASWQAVISQESHSLNADPLFVSISDLHINTSLASPVANAGTPVSGITDDIDNNTRSVTTPDIGADEFDSAAAPPLILGSGANFGSNEIAPDSAVTAFGTNLAGALVAATTLPLPTSLAGTTVTVVDSASVSRAAGLYFVAPGRVSFLLPANTAAGTATVTINAAGGTMFTATIEVATVAPGLFSAESNGAGVMKGYAIRTVGMVETIEQVARFNQPSGRWVEVALAAPTEQLTLVLLGTGFRNRVALPTVTVGGVAATATYAGASSAATGFDELRVQLPAGLSSGSKNINVTVDGKPANIVTVRIQ